MVAWPTRALMTVFFGVLLVRRQTYLVCYTHTDPILAGSASRAVRLRTAVGAHASNSKDHLAPKLWQHPANNCA